MDDKEDKSYEDEALAWFNKSKVMNNKEFMRFAQGVVEMVEGMARKTLSGLHVNASAEGCYAGRILYE